jgi:general stress protein 26
VTDTNSTIQQATELINSQRFGILATRERDDLHMSMVAFLADSSLRTVYFPTPSTTRKYANLLKYPSVSFLIDNRGDFRNTLSSLKFLTVKGDASPVAEDEHDAVKGHCLQKHPDFEQFLSSPDIRFFAIVLKQIDLVSHLSTVVTLELKTEEDSSYWSEKSK